MDGPREAGVATRSGSRGTQQPEVTLDPAINIGYYKGHDYELTALEVRGVYNTGTIRPVYRCLKVRTLRYGHIGLFVTPEGGSQYYRLICSKTVVLC